MLLEPTLIREIRAPNGTVRYRHRVEPVRRVVSPEVAAKLRDLLRGVVEQAGGTGERAALANFQLAAKTGTARRVVGGRYAAGQYTASFAALFPADEPQLVVVMKIDNPQKGSYFAAQTAAPVTRSMLEQALAARTVALDRARLSNVAPTEDRAAHSTKQHAGLEASRIRRQAGDRGERSGRVDQNAGPRQRVHNLFQGSHCFTGGGSANTVIVVPAGAWSPAAGQVW